MRPTSFTYLPDIINRIPKDKISENTPYNFKNKQKPSFLKTGEK